MLFVILILPIITISSIFLLNRFRPNFKSHWLLAFTGVLVGWVLMLYQIIILAGTNEVLTMTALNMLQLPVIFVMNNFSLGVAFAFQSYGMAVVLKSVGQTGKKDWQKWIYVLITLVIAAFSIFAGNWVTLLLAWSVVDIYILIISLTALVERKNIIKHVKIFTVNIMSTMILLIFNLFRLVNLADNSDSEVGKLIVATTLIFSILLRFSSILRKNIPSSRVHVFLSIVVTFSIFSHPNLMSTLQQLPKYLAIMMMIIALIYSGKGVFGNNNPVVRVGNFAFSTGLIALSGEILDYENVSMVSILIFIYIAGYISLQESPGGRLTISKALLVFSLSSLPYSLTFFSGILFLDNINNYWILFILWQSIIIFSLIRNNNIQGQESHSDLGRLHLITKTGALVLPFILVGYSLVSKQTSNNNIVSSMQFVPVGMNILFVGILFEADRRLRNSKITFSSRLKAIFNFDWIMNVYKKLVAILEIIIKSVSAILEGEGGILWAILIIVLMATLFSQSGV